MKIGDKIVGLVLKTIDLNKVVENNRIDGATF